MKKIANTLEENKTIWLFYVVVIIIGLLILSLLSSCSRQDINPGNDTGDQTNDGSLGIEKECKNRCDGKNCVNDCLDDYYLLQKKCENIISDKKKNSCLKLVTGPSEAYKKLDPSLCFGDDKCISSVLSYKATKELNEKFCENPEIKSVQECKDNVVLKKALAKTDIETCKSIIDKSKQEMCMQSIKQILAVWNSDIEACKNIDSSGGGGQNCIDQIYSRKAKLDMDITICSKISDESEKMNCERFISIHDEELK